jgi:ubiquinone/menaquinone biosynthesis C-methylase UbiE
METGPVAEEVTTSADDTAKLRALITGYEAAQCVYAAAKLGVADALGDGPRSVNELAEALRADAGALGRLMRGLASLGVAVEHDGNAFALTSLGERLRSNVPGSLRPIALLSGERSYRVWGALAYSVTTGRTAFEHVYGATTFDYMTAHPDLAAIYDEAMSAGTALMVRAVLAAVDFSRFQTVVDVGGGVGQLLAAVISAHGHTEGVLLDRAPVIEHAREQFRTAGLETRCRLAAGDFFHSVPSGGDAYVLSHVLHNWDDERSETILRACRAAMRASATLLVVEKIMPDVVDASATTQRVTMADLHMLVITGGRERRRSEYDRLLGPTGFRITGVIPTDTAESVIEARPV